MAPKTTSFFARLLALPKIVIQVLTSADFFSYLLKFNAQNVQVTESPVAADEKPVAQSNEASFQVPDIDGALQMLSLLQQEARFIDFLQEDISQYQDSEIGAAARVIHEGAQKLIQSHFKLAPIQEEAEGASVNLESGFDASRIRVTGNVVGEPPFKGILAHPGWQVLEFNLPKVSKDHDIRILTPAEVAL